MNAARKIVYIRARDRPLYYQSIRDEKILGRGYHPVRRILYPDMTENTSLEIAAGDKVEIIIPGTQLKQIARILDVPLDADFSNQPEYALSMPRPSKA